MAFIRWTSSPIWLLHGTLAASNWLFAPRARSNPIVIYDFTDPFHEERDKYPPVIDSAVFLITEELWVRTTASAVPAVKMSDDQKLVTPVGPVGSYESIKRVEELTSADVIIWGGATREFDRDGFEVKVRARGETSERTFTAPLDELASMLGDWLVRRNLCERTVPPSWWRMPVGDELSRYASVVDDVLVQGLAHKTIGALSALSVDDHRKITAHALDAVADMSTGGEQVALLAITAAIIARRADALSDELHARGIAVVDALSHPDLRKLAGCLLARLGDERGRAMVASELAAIGGGYRASADLHAAWLKELLADLDSESGS